MANRLVGIMIAVIIGGIAPAYAQDDASKGVIYIPSIGLIEAITPTFPVHDAYYDEYDTYTIGDGVQWLSDSVWINDGGRVILAGHTPGVFEPLHRIQTGDQIMIYDDHAVVTYTVTGLFLAEVHEIEWMRESAESKLLIITCEGEKRLLVEAHHELGRGF